MSDHETQDLLPPTPPLIHVLQEPLPGIPESQEGQAILISKPTAGQKRKRSPSSVSHIQSTPQPRHPYLSGNYASIKQTLPLTPCTWTGEIPAELAGGEYVRNGSNPVSNEDLGRDAHWFDGDGMLAGVSFTRDTKTGAIIPEFVNQFVLTDIYLSATTSPRLRVPILPSIATLVNPLSSFLWVAIRVFRTIILILLSHLPGSKHPIKKISAANTNVVYHDGRALATCESGPPMRILLPGLETVGWYNGAEAENEPIKSTKHLEVIDEAGELLTDREPTTLGGDSTGLLGFMREWTTAHPKVDPVTQEMLMFHSCFAPPYVQYSVIPSESASTSTATPLTKIVNAPVPGVASAKMMHDFGVSHHYTVIMDLPLSLDPVNQVTGQPTVAYDSSKPSRFGVFPRRDTKQVRWFETDACCIFHTANTWDEFSTVAPPPASRGVSLRNSTSSLQRAPAGQVTAVNMLACRLTSATLVFAAGNIAPPAPKQRKRARVAPAQNVVADDISDGKKKRMPFFSKYEPEPVSGRITSADDEDKAVLSFERSTRLEEDLSLDVNEKEPLLHLSSSHYHYDDPDEDDVDPEEEQCRLYFYQFNLLTGCISHQFALASIPFEFPSVRPDKEMQAARYVYGCSTTATSFGAALGKATKIDLLVKMDVETLVARGRRSGDAPPPIVDTRSLGEILASDDVNDPIRVFRMPPGWCAGEMRFVPAASSTSTSRCNTNNETTNNNDNHNTTEDAGYLLFYAFDESQLCADGSVPDDSDPIRRARSELWILNAKDMRTIVARIRLPQRVPYGLHGTWFDEGMIKSQREVLGVRKEISLSDETEGGKGVWTAVREMIETALG